MNASHNNEPAEDPDASSDETSFWDQLGDESSNESADWSGNELEQAYLRAMEVLDASEAEITELAAEQTVSDDPIEMTSPQPLLTASENQPVGDDEPKIGQTELVAELGRLSQEATQRSQPPDGSPVAVAPRQVLEALLFVGGEPLTTKRLSGVLRGEFSAEFIESQLDELNALYAAEARPYEIRLGDGGYRIHLREDMERIRRKVYGLGPKEVRLSQDTLEVLSVVAYHQPITAAEIEELGKSECGAALRQLLRRELIVVERPSKTRSEVAYRTTPRFLSLFGIRNLNELPRHEQVGYK